MSIFNLTKEIAIDLGTANTIIITDGQITVEEPSVVAPQESPSCRLADSVSLSTEANNIISYIFKTISYI
ncbi:MAG: rod shape-determining protein [Bacteroidales bacterium]|nr:rod shape-determining protein [Bacteroidales bacterium]